MFESTLNVSLASPRNLGKGALFSIAAHLAAVAVALHAAAHTPPAKIEAPEVTFRMAAPPPPPPPLGGGSAETRSEPAKKPRVKPDSYVPRDPVKKLEEANPAPAVEAVGQPDGDPNGQVGGAKGGLVGGVIGGTGTELHGDPGIVGVPAPPPERSNVVIPFGAGMDRPQMLAGPEPVFPREAREARVEGTLIARCVITTEGTLQDCRILKSLPFLDQPVLDALARRRYTPVSFQGRPVAVAYTIPFKFTLQ
jgi:periplasmic protein TonB